MKKTYQIPTTTIVKVQVARMIATSSIEVYGKNATSAGMSREGNGFWDDEEEEE
jgi:hypothetical protein